MTNKYEPFDIAERKFAKAGEHFDEVRSQLRSDKQKLIDAEDAPYRNWRELPKMNGLSFEVQADLDAFSSLMGEPFVAEFASFIADFSWSNAPVHGVLVQKAEHTRWCFDWMILPRWSSYATCSLLQRKGEWLVYTTDQHRLSLPSHWNVLAV